MARGSYTIAGNESNKWSRRKDNFYKYIVYTLLIAVIICLVFLLAALTCTKFNKFHARDHNKHKTTTGVLEGTQKQEEILLTKMFSTPTPFYNSDRSTEDGKTSQSTVEAASETETYLSTESSDGDTTGSTEVTSTLSEFVDNIHIIEANDYD